MGAHAILFTREETEARSFIYTSGSGGLLGVHALNLGAIGSGSTKGHPSINLLGGLDHPGQAGLFPVWREKIGFQGFVNLCSLCHYNLLAAGTNLPPHQKQKKKWMESHPSSAGLLPLRLGEELPQGQALLSPLQLNRHSRGPTLPCGVCTLVVALQPLEVDRALF